jgi:hypothetical protein
MGAADAEFGRNYAVRIRLAVVVGNADQFIVDAARVRKSEQLFTETLAPGDGKTVFAQMRFPKLQG